MSRLTISDGCDQRDESSKGAAPKSAFTTSSGGARKKPKGKVSMAEVNATISV